MIRPRIASSYRRSLASFYERLQNRSITTAALSSERTEQHLDAILALPQDGTGRKERAFVRLVLEDMRMKREPFYQDQFQIPVH